MKLATLAGFLRWQRRTLGLRCSGLDSAARARRGVEPSPPPLPGPVRRLAHVEGGWFRVLMAGRAAPPQLCAGSRCT